MVLIHNYEFPKTSIVPEFDLEYSKYESYFGSFGFELSDFQKWAIVSIVNQENTLVTAHTGSGKTLPAEFAIQYFTSLGKKVIYTSPIKALSNQKFHEFTLKYPNLSVGIMTGDNKHNPEADVLIMTTEILRNQLLSLIPKSQENELVSSTVNQFSMDICKDCGIIIFDEIHYIDDPDRGAVWEQCIMHSPSHIPLLMLSASIGKPEVFASWIEKVNPTKTVHICPTYHRVVPLEHFSYITLPNACVEKIKDKETKIMIESHINKLHVIKNTKSELCDAQFTKMHKVTSLIEKNGWIVNRKYAMNELLTFLKNNDMLPALCFVFSRKQVENVAQEISQSLWKDDEIYEDPIPITIERQCTQILVSKVTNWKEYINLQEFRTLLSCLKKGVAYHHAGMIPVFKEMVEILFSMKKVKLLVATETFAVGLNMPTKTVIFSSLYKFNGNGMRLLEGHEYTQMAGRAGRRNLDTRGYVIHMNNLFEMPDSLSYKRLINASPKIIKSRFKLSIPFMLHIIAGEEFQESFSTTYLCKHIEKSMMMNDINSQISYSNEQIEKLIMKEEKMKKGMGTKLEVYQHYKSILELIEKSKNKQRKRAINEKRQLIMQHKFLENDYENEYVVYMQTLDDLQKEEANKGYAEDFIASNVKSILHILSTNGFMENNKITQKGKVACSVMEIHGLVFSELYMYHNGFEDLSYNEIGQLLSCFYPIKVNDEKKSINIPDFTGYKLRSYLEFMKDKFDHYYDLEVKYGIDVGYDYETQYDLMKYIERWCFATDASHATSILSDLKHEKEVFLGDFVKCCMKIVSILQEAKVICETSENYTCLEKLNMLEKCLMKFIVSNESLYL